jgi:CheY-like chemotaxis protein
MGKLLIVDDEPSTRLILSQILTSLGHEVRCAVDGFEALARIRETIPDILLSDLNMPGMSGFELLSIVRRRLPGLYVIATSGAYSGNTVPHGIAADAFYEKASGIQTLLTMLQSITTATMSPYRSVSDSAPIWISRTECSPGGRSLMAINCPECLRNSTQLCSDSVLAIHHTNCLYCGCTIYYAIIQPMDSRSSLANLPGLSKPTPPHQPQGSN